MSAPVIGISGSSHKSASVQAMMAQVRAADAVPLFIGNHAGRIARAGGDAAAAVKADLAKVDALVVMGNDGDINPARYGQQPHPKTTIETDTAREAYEFAAIKETAHQNMPLLGVCGGMQRINVTMGGTLHQHVPDLLGGDTSHTQQDKGIMMSCPVQAVQLFPGSTLAGLAKGIKTVYTPTHETMPDGVVAENSVHHQAVAQIAPCLREAARSLDGITEAIEAHPAGKHKAQFLLGVQWHPEFGASPLGPRLVGAVAGAAQAFVQKNQRSHPLHEAVDETLFSHAAPAPAQPALRRDAAQPAVPTSHLARLQQSPPPGMATVRGA